MDTLSTQRRFSQFIGIDLGGGKGKNTAIALIVRDGEERGCVRFVGTRTSTGRPFYDDVLLPFLLEQPADTVLAIDAPLTLTACMRCRRTQCPGVWGCPDDAVDWLRRHVATSGQMRERSVADKPILTPYTQRACEVLLTTRYGVAPREALGQGMGPLTARAHHLRQALAVRYTLNETLIEVFPRATLRALFGLDQGQRYKRQLNTWHTRAQMLEALSASLRFEVWREGVLSSDHCFDAVICAYTAMLWAVQGWTLPVQDRAIFVEDGWIWAPEPQPTTPEE